MTRKPRVLTKCVANSYTGPNERIVEFSDARGVGGLISFRATEQGELIVELYRLDPAVKVLLPHTEAAR